MRPCVMEDGGPAKTEDILGLARDWTQAQRLCLSDQTNWIDLVLGGDHVAEPSSIDCAKSLPSPAAIVWPRHGQLTPDMWPTYGRAADKRDHLFRVSGRTLM